MKPRRLRFDIRQAGRPLMLVLLVLFALNVAAYAFLVRPTVKEYRSLMQGHQPELQALSQRRAEVKRLEKFLAGLQHAERDLATLRSDVLSSREERMVEVQRELAALCAEFRIDLESVTYDNELLSEEELDRFAMVVPLEGGYANLRRFLQAVEDSDKFLVVERVALGEGREGGMMLSLNITLATYFDVPPELKRSRTPPGRAGGGRT